MIRRQSTEGEVSYPAQVEGILEYLSPDSTLNRRYVAPGAESLARSMLRQAGTPDFRFRRFQAINLWRVLSAPPQDWPLALCDGRSVDPEEGVRNAMIRVDTLPHPGEIAPELPDDPSRPEAFVFHFNPRHRWYYFPDMTCEELLLFKLYDAKRIGAWRVPHASFADPTVRGAAPRASIEIRTEAYFS